MNKRKIGFYSFLILTFCVIILLATSSSVLTIDLDNSNSIPMGTFITWVGMISLPLSIFFGIGKLRKPTGKFNRILAMLLKFILVLAILWVPISYLLAGNISFNFSEKETFQGGQVAMKWFWGLSFGIGLGAILILVMYWVSLLFKKK